MIVIGEREKGRCVGECAEKLRKVGVNENIVSRNKRSIWKFWTEVYGFGF